MENTMMFFFLCLSVTLFFPGSLTQNADSEKGMIVSFFPGVYVGHIEVFRGDINSIATSAGGDKYGFSGDNSGMMITTFASDPMGQSLHYIDVATNGIYRINNFTLAVDHPNISRSTVHKGLSRATCKIAYDYITKNIYWTDPLLHKISVQFAMDPDAKPRTLFSELVSYPVGITIDPSERLLFWSNYQDVNMIERSNLDGSVRELVVSSNLGHIEDIVADINTKTLYWIDSYKMTVEKCNYKGAERATVRLIAGYEFTSMTINDHAICLANYDKGFIACIQKTSGALIFRKSTEPSDPYGITIYDKSNQKDSINYCANHKCSHICLNGQSGAVCTCENGATLQSDKMTCKRDHKFHPSGFIAANATHVCSLDTTIINGVTGDPICIECNSGGTPTLALDTHGNKGYYYNLTDKSIWSLDFATEEKTFIVKVSEGVSDMTFDWTDDVLYAVSKTAGTLTAYSLKTLPQVPTEVHYSGLNQPSEIEIDAHNGTLYWLQADGIFTGTRDKQPKKNIVGPPQLGNGVALFYDHLFDEIFWVDDSKGALYSSRFDGSNVQHWQFVPNVKHLVIHKDNAIWNDGQGRIFSTLYALSGVEHQKNEIKDMNKVTAFEIFDKTAQPKQRSPCHGPDNGGCEHLCFSTADFNVLCQCDFGYTREADNKSCGTTPLVKDFLLITDLAHDNIHQIPTSGAEVKTLDFPDVFVPAMVRYYKGSVYWSDTGNKKIKRGTLEGKNVETVFSIGEGFADRMAFDYTTDLLFFTVTEPNHRNKGFIGVLKPDGQKEKYKRLVEGLEWPGGIAVVPHKGYLFFDNHEATNTYIGRCETDGTQCIHILSSSISTPLGLAVDYKNEKLYWTDALDDGIFYSNFDGSDKTRLYQDPLGDLIDLTISDGMLYAVGYNRQTILKINMKTGKREKFMRDYAEFGPLDSVDIFPTDNLQIANDACALSNGGCEYYCLAKPSQKRVCGCPEGLAPAGVGGTKCAIPSSSCPLIIENGYFENGCTANPGSKCSYACDQGFSKNPAITSLTCNTNLQWDKDLTKLCLPSCGKSLTIPNGKFASSCKGDLGEKCGFSCNTGYNKSTIAPEKLTCTTNAEWDVAPETLCVKSEVKCDANAIVNGALNSDCEAKEAHFCGFKCNTGYEAKNSSITFVKCLTTGKWDQDTKTLCISQQFCTADIANGRLSATCKRIRGVLCGYQCDTGYGAATVSLRCKDDHTWDQDPKTICSRVQVVGPAEKQGQSNNDSGTSDGVVAGLAALCGILVILIVLGAVFFFFRRRILSQDGKQQGVYRASPNVYFNAGEGIPNGAGGATGFTNPVVQMNGDSLPNTTPRTLDQVVIDANTEAVIPEKQNYDNLVLNKSAGVYDTIKEKDPGVPNPLYSELHPSEELSYKMDDGKDDDQPTKPGNVYQRFH